MSTSKKAWRRRIGRVTVYQRGGRFWIYYRDIRPVGTSREAALALAAKINAQLADGTPTMLAFQSVAVTAMIAKWLDHHEHVRRSAVNTVNRYRTAIEHLKQFIEANHSGLRADRFDSGMAEQFVRHLRTAKISPNGCKGATKRTMRDTQTAYLGLEMN
jgi:integrase